MAFIIKNEKEFANMILGNSVVIIDFYGDNCAPCKITAPIFDELATQMTDVAFGKINVEHKATEEIVLATKIQKMPTFAIFVNGEYVNKHLGGMTKNQMIAFINGYRQ
jgi:thioredoxin 1